MAKKDYTVVVAFMSDCCGNPHLWQESVKANTRGQAAKIVIDSVRAGKNDDDPARDVYEYTVFDGVLGGTGVREA